MTAEPHFNYLYVICPHCLHAYQAEAEDFNEQEREETCEKCGGRYTLYDEITVTHHTRPIIDG
jgi:transcriptional regulator NrdR family protein